jgi:hypothetical protein
MHVVLARAKLQYDRLEPDARSAIIIRQNHIAKIVPIPLKVAWTPPKLSFHSCNYDIFSERCPYVVWATCIHNSVSHGDAAAVD